MQKYQTQFMMLLILLFGCVVAFQSFFSDYPAAFLFPKIISVILIGFALLGFVLTFNERKPLLDMVIMRPMFFGFIMMFILIYGALTFLGFYSASYIFLLILLSYYDGKSHQDVKAWLQRFLVSTLFMVVIYLLFALLLKVQTPSGLLL